jgi:hypothetical protein
MKLWKITRRSGEQEVLMYVLAERWFDARAFACQQSGLDTGAVLVEQSAHFVETPRGMKKKLKFQAFRLEWHGHAAGRYSTLHLVSRACKTLEELYAKAEGMS